MKRTNIIIILLMIALIIGTLSVQSCVPDASKAAITEEVNVDVKPSEINEEYILDLNGYKQYVEPTFLVNEQKIKEFKTRITQSDKKTKADYSAKISQLELRNIEMKNKLDQYKCAKIEDWKIFKTEFSKEMDKLSMALKDLTAKLK